MDNAVFYRIFIQRFFQYIMQWFFQVIVQIFVPQVLRRFHQEFRLLYAQKLVSKKFLTMNSSDMFYGKLSSIFFNIAKLFLIIPQVFVSGFPLKVS